MNALLILLGMFSLTLIVTKLGFLKRANAFSFISVPLLLGLAFSPEGWIPMLPSTREDLSWALRVALLWMTFLAGTRLSEVTFKWEQVKKLLPFFIGYFVFFLSSFFVIDFFVPAESSQETFALAVILSSALFSSKENPFLLFILFFSLFYLFKQGPLTWSLQDLAYPLAVGLLLGVVGRLIISPHSDLNTPTRLTLLGLCVLGTGWSIGIGSLEVLVGLSFGWAMAFIHKYGICKDPKLRNSEAPVLFVVPFFAGLYFHPTWEVILIGLILALLRLSMKWYLLRIGVRKATLDEIFTLIIPISYLALPITLSLHLSPLSNENTLFILSTFCVGFIVNDLMALFLESFRRDSEGKRVYR